MRSIIYGAGAIGGVVGGCLAQAGSDVLLIGRSHQVKTINENGLKLIMPDKTHVLRVPAVTAPDQIKFGPDDVVFLCIKGQNTEGAISDLSAVVKDMPVPVFCFQNGVRNEATVTRSFRSVYGVTVRVGAVYLTDGEVICRRDPPGWLVIGCYPTGTNALVEKVAEELRHAGFFVKVTPDIMPYKWGKLMLNLANAVGAITNGRGAEVDLINQATRKEAQDILAQAKQRWVSDDELGQEWPEFKTTPRATITTEAQSSTWQSLARTQGSVETEYLNGEIVKLANRLGLRAPINEKILHISREMGVNRELPGKYPPARLLEILGIKT
ncbi:MAG: 2-dehydropantoate 2-reductase [Chloroflexota bacterium]